MLRASDHFGLYSPDPATQLLFSFSIVVFAFVGAFSRQSALAPALRLVLASLASQPGGARRGGTFRTIRTIVRAKMAYPWVTHHAYSPCALPLSTLDGRLRPDGPCPFHIPQKCNGNGPSFIHHSCPLMTSAMPKPRESGPLVRLLCVAYDGQLPVGESCPRHRPPKSAFLPENPSVHANEAGVARFSTCHNPVLQTGLGSSSLIPY